MCQSVYLWCSIDISNGHVGYVKPCREGRLPVLAGKEGSAADRPICCVCELSRQSAVSLAPSPAPFRRAGISDAPPAHHLTISRPKVATHTQLTVGLLTEHADDVVLRRTALARGGAVVAPLSTAASDGRPFGCMKESGASQLQADESVQHRDERHGRHEEHERGYLEGVLHVF